MTSDGVLSSWKGQRPFRLLGPDRVSRTPLLATIWDSGWARLSASRSWRRSRIVFIAQLPPSRDDGVACQAGEADRLRSRLAPDVRPTARRARAVLSSRVGARQ